MQIVSSRCITVKWNGCQEDWSSSFCLNLKMRSSLSSQTKLLLLITMPTQRLQQNLSISVIFFHNWSPADLSSREKQQQSSHFQAETCFVGQEVSGKEKGHVCTFEWQKCKRSPPGCWLLLDCLKRVPMSCTECCETPLSIRDYAHTWRKSGFSIVAPTKTKAWNRFREMLEATLRMNLPPIPRRLASISLRDRKEVEW